MEFQVAFVKVGGGERGVGTVNAGLYGGSEHEQGGAGAVVGAFGGVFGDATAEFGEGHAEAVGGVSHAGAVLCGNGADFVGGKLGVEGGAFEEIEGGVAGGTGFIFGGIEVVEVGKGLFHAFIDVFVAGEPLIGFGSLEGDGGGLVENDVDDVGTVEVAAVAEEVFDAVIVFLGVEEEAVSGVGPTGEGAGGFLDVLFGVVADAEGEEFHEFAGVVFVGSGFFVLVVVEVFEHGGVLGDFEGEGFEVAEGVFAEEEILLVEEV